MEAGTGSQAAAGRAIDRSPDLTTGSSESSSVHDEQWQEPPFEETATGSLDSDEEPDQEPEEFDTWDTPAEASRRLAGDHCVSSQLEAAWSLQWEVSEAPLGQKDLGRFGPNGPPMNVMDFCPVTGRLCVANQSQLIGLSASGLKRLAASQAEGAEEPAPDGSTVQVGSVPLDAQVNRLRCGLLHGRPVVATADARGGVTVHPTDALSIQAGTRLQNRDVARGTPISTWGLALAPHFETGLSHSAGLLAVSANDHCVKAWTLRPRETAWPLSESGASPVSVSESGASTASAAGYPAGAPKTTGPRVLITHSGNLPCIDVAGGQLLSASLDGSVQTVQVASTIGEVQRFMNPGAEGGGIWGVCWVPLRSIRVADDVRQGPRAEDVLPDRVGGDHIQWAVHDVMLPEEIVAAFILPFLDVEELLGGLQMLSVAHSRLAVAEVVSSHRTENYAFCFSDGAAWLLSPSLKALCKLQLPFDASFAHVAYVPGLSAAVLAPKGIDDQATRVARIGVITLLRRQRSLRFKLQVHHVCYDHPDSTWPAGVLVGMAASPEGEIFTLLASRRLTCHRLEVRRARVQGEEDGGEMRDPGGPDPEMPEGLEVPEAPGAER